MYERYSGKGAFAYNMWRNRSVFRDSFKRICDARSPRKQRIARATLRKNIRRTYIDFVAIQNSAVRGYIVAKDAAGAVQVYEPHFYTCEKREDMKQQKKKPEKDYRTEAEKERKKEEQREAIRQRREEDREAYIKARLAQQSMFSNRDEVYE